MLESWLLFSSFWFISQMVSSPSHLHGLAKWQNGFIWLMKCLTTLNLNRICFSRTLWYIWQLWLIGIFNGQLCFSIDCLRKEQGNIWCNPVIIWLKTEMSGQKKESELNSSNCYLIKYWHYTVWAKIRSWLKDAEPDNSLHAHWHFIVEPSKVELRFWEVAKVLWKLEQLLSIRCWNWFSMADGFQLNYGKLRNRNSSRHGTATKDSHRRTQILSKWIE